MDHKHEHEALKRILQHQEVKKAPSGMSDAIMKEFLQAEQPKLALKPLISPKAWIINALGFLLLIAWSMKSSSSVPAKSNPYLHLIDQQMDQFSHLFIGISPIFMMSLASFGCMMFLSAYVLKHRSGQHWT
jgi:hypothetical protein